MIDNVVTMNRDSLYLLKPNFHDAGRVYFCPGCAEMLGLLEFYPALKSRLSVQYLNFARPRQELVALLGEEHQSCPVLVLAEPSPKLPPHLKVHQAKGRAFVEGAREIAEYLAHVHGTGLPH